MKDAIIPNQYYKDILTGVEMNFTFHLPYGWCVSFPNIDSVESLDYLPKVEYPETPEKYKPQIKQFFKNLEKRYSNV